MAGTYTVEDYFSLVPEGTNRWELIRGFFEMSPAPLDIHQRVSADLQFLIHGHFMGKPCQVRSAPYDVILSNNVVQPDLCVICDLSKIKRKGCYGAPDMIVEIVSKSTRPRDLADKFTLYEEHSVSEYWVVFPDEQEVWKYVLDNDKYSDKELFVLNDILHSSIFPGLEINLIEIFENQFLVYED